MILPERVLGTSAEKMIFSGRAKPFLEMSSESEMLNFVRNTQGAVGYVSATTAIGTGLKVLRVR